MTYTLTSLTANAEYSLKIVAENVRGESEIPSGVIYQYAAAVPTSITAPAVISGSRT